MLQLLQRLPIVGTIISNIKMALIIAAVVAGTNAVSGLVFYIKGHNAAAARCQINSIKRERDEMKRDRDTAIATSSFLNTKLRELQGKQDERDAKDRDASSKREPIAGCVVPLLPVGRVRNVGHQR